MTGGVERGRDWGRPTNALPDAIVHGPDAALAAAAVLTPEALFGFEPDATSDFARVLGMPAALPAAARTEGGIEVVLDRFSVAGDGAPPVAGLNAAVIGTPPRSLRWWSSSCHVTVADGDASPWFVGKATTVVIANGQFVGGDDLNPRSHPGDGQLEAYVYTLDRGERAAMRRRLATGTHVPHPRIVRRAVTRVCIRSARPCRVAVDGRPLAAVSEITVTVAPGGLRVLLSAT